MLDGVMAGSSLSWLDPEGSAEAARCWREVAVTIGDGTRLVVPDLPGRGGEFTAALAALGKIEQQASDIVAASVSRTARELDAMTRSAVVVDRFPSGRP